MEPKPLALSPAEKLLALRELDIFHRWESIDERRYCRGCGKSISGREIKVFARRDGDQAFRLECPTEGCLSVPIDWIMPEPLAPKLAAVKKASGSRWEFPLRHSSIFGFLRAPQIFF